MNKSLITMAVLAALTAGAAQAAVLQSSVSGRLPAAHFSADAAIQRPAQPLTVADRGFSRATTVTNRAGKTAERKVSGSVNAETKTRTRAVEGTTFQGKTYTGASTAQRTENGYVRSNAQVGPNGGTRTREVEAEVDRDNGTITKGISVTGPNGGTRSTTVVKHYENSGDGAE